MIRAQRRRFNSKHRAMTSPISTIRAHLATFLNGGDYESFWDAISETSEAIDADDSVSNDDREWFDELYDAAYMGAEDPIDAKSSKEGMVGAAELRKQIREMGLDS